MPFVTYLPGTAPLVLDSPHSGTDYPDDFGTVCDRGTLLGDKLTIRFQVAGCRPAQCVARSFA